MLSPPDMFNHVFSVVCPITECVNTNVTREKKLASKNKLIYSKYKHKIAVKALS